MKWDLICGKCGRQKDPHFDDDWQSGKGMPHQKWASFKSDGNITFGTLIILPINMIRKRIRFSEESREAYERERAKVVQEIRQARPDFDDVIKRGMEIYEDSDVARMNYKLHGLAMECGYREQGDVEKLLIDHMQEQRRGKEMTLREMQGLEITRDYVIPGLLARPYTTLLHGKYGTGKSSTILGLMKHICDGIPFQLDGATVPVEQGKCIYFNADMSASDFRTEADLHEIKNVDNFVYVPDFNLYRKMEFIKTMNKT